MISHESPVPGRLQLNSLDQKDGIQNQKSSNSLPCDRRLSRAARAILIDKTLPILRHYSETIDKISLSTLSNADKMEYYRSSIVSLANNPKTCILNPQRDIYWQEETLHKIVTPRNTRRRNQHQKLHECGLCGKKFVSKYYLDLHVDTKHGKDRSPPNEIGYEVCPAIHLCNLIGGQYLCNVKALNDEPYYASGILYDTHYIHHQHNLHSQSVKRKYQKDTYSNPCNDSLVQYCHDEIEMCFGGNNGLVNDLSSLLCDTQSCHHRLYSILNSVVSIHHGYEEWDNHHDEINSIGYFGIILIVGFVIYHGWEFWGNWVVKRFKRKKRIVMDRKKLE